MKRFIGACKGCVALCWERGNKNQCYVIVADRAWAAIMGIPKAEGDELPSTCPRVLEHTVLGQQMALSGKEGAQ